MARSHEQFVEKQRFAFRARPGSIRLNGTVRIGWEAVSTATGDGVGGGSDILVLDDNGRTKIDYMFPGP